MGSKYFVSVALIILLGLSVIGGVTSWEVKKNGVVVFSAPGGNCVYYTGGAKDENDVWTIRGTVWVDRYQTVGAEVCYSSIGCNQFSTGIGGSQGKYWTAECNDIAGVYEWKKMYFAKNGNNLGECIVYFEEEPDPTIQIIGEPSEGFGYPPSDGSMIVIDEESPSSWYGEFMLSEGWELSGVSYDSDVFKNVSTQYLGLSWYKYDFEVDKGNMGVGNYALVFEATYSDEPATVTFTKEFGDFHFLVVDGEPKSVFLDEIYIDGGWFFNSETGKWEYSTDEGIWLVYDAVTGKLEVRSDNAVTKDASGTINTGGKQLLYVTKDGSVTTTVGDHVGVYNDEPISIGGYDYNQYITIDNVDYGVDDSGNIHWIPGEPSKTELVMEKPIYFGDDIWGKIKQFFYDMIFPDDWSMWDDLRVYLGGKFPFSMFIRLGEGEYTWFTNEEVDIKFSFSYVDEMFEEEVDLTAGWLEGIGNISRPFTRWLFIALFVTFLIRRFIPSVVFK